MPTTPSHPPTGFSRLARATARWAGKPTTFLGAVAIIVMWGMTGSFFHYSDTWQLVVNTGTTIITFLMVFLIQNSQNRDSEAIQVKLDELIRSMKGAHNRLIDLEEMDQDQLEAIHREYSELARVAREAHDRGERDTDTHDVNGPEGEEPDTTTSSE